MVLRLFTLSIIISTSMNIFLPVAIRNENFGGTIFLRIIQGLAEGMLYPCCHGIWAKWAPPLERSRLATISFSGSYAGTRVQINLFSNLGIIINELLFLNLRRARSWLRAWWIFDRQLWRVRSSVAILLLLFSQCNMDRCVKARATEACDVLCGSQSCFQ